MTTTPFPNTSLHLVFRRDRTLLRRRPEPRLRSRTHSSAKLALVRAGTTTVRPSVCPSVRSTARSLFLSLTLYSALARVTLAYLRSTTRSGRKARECSLCSTFVLRRQELTVSRTVHVKPLRFLPRSFRSAIPFSLFLSSSFSTWLDRRGWGHRWWERDAWSIESKTEATRFRCGFFLVARASLAAAAGKLRASPCARKRCLPLAAPLSESGCLSCRSLSSVFD